MSSLIDSLKSEIARVARKELKEELLALRKATTAHRSEIAALKRQVKSLASALKATVKASRSNGKETSAADTSAAATGIRFSAARLAALRAKGRRFADGRIAEETVNATKKTPAEVSW